MLSTVDHDGTISSRPMATQDEPFNGTIWFLTRSSSDKIHEVEGDHHVTLNYADPSDSKYIALKGKASVSHDRNKIKQLWNPMYKAWFPKGEDDPDIAVLKVEITEGDYWEANSSKIIMGFKYLAAALYRRHRQDWRSRPRHHPLRLLSEFIATRPEDNRSAERSSWVAHPSTSAPPAPASSAEPLFETRS